MELVGWIGSFLLSICGAPLAWSSWRRGHSTDINMPFIQLWLWGEIFTIVYVLAQPEILWPLVANYAFNIFLIGVVLRYYYYPRQEAATESD